MFRRNRNADKRRCARYPLDLEARMYSNGDPEGISCSIADISQEGMAVKLSCLTDAIVGQQIVVRIAFDGNDGEISSLSDLKWVQPVPGEKKDGALFIGMQFNSINPKVKRTLLEHAYNNWFRTA